MAHGAPDDGRVRANKGESPACRAKRRDPMPAAMNLELGPLNRRGRWQAALLFGAPPQRAQLARRANAHHRALPRRVVTYHIPTVVGAHRNVRLHRPGHAARISQRLRRHQRAHVARDGVEATRRHDQHPCFLGRLSIVDRDALDKLWLAADVDVVGAAAHACADDWLPPEAVGPHAAHDDLGAHAHFVKACCVLRVGHQDSGRLAQAQLGGQRLGQRV
mmetsp:Transcript_517/g.1544  ORF Transcript_517/g.1544 Transcript_517/m.1544 type:complete len:219 (+) Transcript_517:496-1152(+)